MKLFVALLLASAVSIAPPLAAQPRAQADTVDPTVPTQLPRTAIPHHYAVTVTPHVSKLAFDGRVAIDLEVMKPARQLVLNAADLRFATATLRPAKGGAALSGRVSVIDLAISQEHEWLIVDYKTGVPRGDESMENFIDRMRER